MAPTGFWHSCRNLHAERHEWPQPFAAVVERIKPLARRAAPWCWRPAIPSITAWPASCSSSSPSPRCAIIPHLSAFSLAAARLGWPLPDCDTLTLHGRDAANIEAFIQPGASLIVLTADATTIAEVARRLAARGFGKSAITVLENMGGRARAHHQLSPPMPCRGRRFSDLNTLAIQCVAGPGAKICSRLAGLPDDAFVHDGQLTKREVRAATLAALAPAPDQLLWDVGAGCGSVAIEWMRATRGCEAIAFESNAERLEMIAVNADQPRHAAPQDRRRRGARIPCRASPRPMPCSSAVASAMPACSKPPGRPLKPGGRMVANVVTLEGELHLVDLQEKHGGDLVRIEISHLTHIGPFRALKPRMAVLQWRAQQAMGSTARSMASASVPAIPN